MRLRVTLMVLALGTAPLAAQTTNWDPDTWTQDGWTVQEGGNLPSGENMLRDQLQEGVPLETIEVEDPLVMRPTQPPPQADPRIRTETARSGAVLRGLDKVSGDTADLTLSPGDSAQFGRLSVTLKECRYPADNPASDAFALIEIAEPGSGARLFSGWMLASSPALNPLDNARYDIWVLRCNNA